MYLSAADHPLHGLPQFYTRRVLFVASARRRRESQRGGNDATGHPFNPSAEPSSLCHTMKLRALQLTGCDFDLVFIQVVAMLDAQAICALRRAPQIQNGVERFSITAARVGFDQRFTIRINNAD